MLLKSHSKSVKREERDQKNKTGNTMATKDTAFSTIFFTILGLSLLINTTFLITVCRRRRLHNGHHFLLSSIALVDIIAAGTWTCLSGVATTIGWNMPGEVCRLQSYLLTLSQTLTAFSLAAVGVERMIRMILPSRHAVIFVPKIVVFLALGLLVFCGVISSIHLYGTLPVTWLTDQRQCGAKFTESIKLLDLTFCLDHAIPFWVFALPAFAAAYIKIWLAKRNSPLSGEIILERNTFAPGDSYSTRLNKLQAKFRPKTNSSTDFKVKKPTLGKRVYTSRGYTEPEHWDSDIEGSQVTVADDARERVHLLPRPEFSALKASSLTTLVTALMWFPWVVVRFVWNYTPFESVPDWIAVLAVILMHFAAVIKPIVLFIANPYYRSAVIKTLRCH